MDTEPGHLNPGKSWSDLLSEAFDLYTANWQPLLILGLVAGLVEWLAQLPTVLSDNAGLQIAGSLLGIVVSFTVGVLVQGALILAVIAIREGQHPDAAGVLQSALDRFGELFWTVLRSAAIIAGFAILILGIPWAINRAVKWCLVLQAVLLGGQDRQTALAYSAGLVAGRGWWKVFWKLFALGIAMAVPIAVFSVVPGMIFDEPLKSLFQAIVTAAVTPLGAVFLTLFYIDLQQTAPAMGNV